MQKYRKNEGRRDSPEQKKLSIVLDKRYPVGSELLAAASPLRIGSLPQHLGAFPSHQDYLVNSTMALASLLMASEMTKPFSISKRVPLFMGFESLSAIA